MSGGFSFPPPPPPPPKASGSTPSQNDYPNRGQGRGRYPGNYRGGRAGHGRGGFGRQDGHLGAGTFSNERLGNVSHSTSNGNMSVNVRNSWRQPTIVSQHQSSDQNIFASNHPIGARATFGGDEYSSTSGFGSQSTHHVNPAQYSSAVGVIPRTHAGHKRKLEALRGDTKERKPAPQTMPATPGFGAPITSPVVVKDKAVASVDSDSRSRPGVRSLGLVPGDETPQYSSDEDNDETQDLDEEAMHAEIGDKLTFEHNGVVISLTSQADLIAWRKERQLNWPTSARMTQKEEERMRVGRERRRLLASSHLLQSYSNDRSSQVRQNFMDTCKDAEKEASQVATELSNQTELHPPQTGAEKADTATQSQVRTLEDLRRRVAESEARNRQARGALGQAEHRANDASQDPVDYASEGSDAYMEQKEDFPKSDKEKTQTIVSNAGRQSPVSLACGTDSEPSSGSESSDSSPEEVASKPSTGARPSSKRVCRYFSANGRCRDGENCGFLHQRPPNTKINVPEARQPRQSKNKHFEHGQGNVGNHRTISQRLNEQEEEQKARTALQVIKFLGSVGFFAESSVGPETQSSI